MDWEETWSQENDGGWDTTDQSEVSCSTEGHNARGRGGAPHLALHVSSSFGPHSQSQLEKLCPPCSRAHQSEAELRDCRPGFMNNE